MLAVLNIDTLEEVDVFVPARVELRSIADAERSDQREEIDAPDELG